MHAYATSGVADLSGTDLRVHTGQRGLVPRFDCRCDMHNDPEHARFVQGWDPCREGNVLLTSPVTQKKEPSASLVCLCIWLG